MRAPSRSKLVMLWSCAGLSLALLVATYAVAAARGAWPKGHPWHGIALGALAAFFAVQTRLHRSGAALRIAAIALPLVAIAAMAAAVFGSRP